LQQKNLIIVFTRNPELGKVKTRLAKTVGNEFALNIYKFLLNHTEQTIRNIDADKAVYYSVKVRDNDMWNNSIYQKQLQQGDGLGIRMLNAFENAFQNNYKKVVIVGSDLFDLQPKHIEEAFNKLDDNNVVIGPAKDGGYYLLGMKKLYPQVFKNKVWGTETVRENTMQDLQNESVFLLEELNDIDTYDDMKDHSTLKKLIKK
jgi:rSAM/selenodomain-associated transferase 1